MPLLRMNHVLVQFRRVAAVGAEVALVRGGAPDVHQHQARARLHHQGDPSSSIV